MKTLYIDCPTGVSGDMFLASLIDAGFPLARLKKELGKLNLKGYALKISRERRHAIGGTRFKVRLTKKEHHHRTFSGIKKIIEKSSLSKDVKELAVRIFANLAEAEGRVHGIPAAKVHFHEVGAVDSIVDIVGAAIAVKGLGIEKVYASAVPLGSGWVKTDHGMLPVPAPATIELMRGIPAASSVIPMELTTPTGAVLLKTLSSGFGTMPAMTVEKIGYGLGGKDFRELPNALRAVIGDVGGVEASKGSEVTVIETNIDDMSPQICGYLIEKLLQEGALDAFFTPVVMKKTRPGILLTVLSDKARAGRLTDIIFEETTSIGVRYGIFSRRCLERKVFSVKTKYGSIKVKASIKDGVVLTLQPEYEDCRAVAVKKGVSLRKVMSEVQSAASAKYPAAVKGVKSGR